MATYKTTIKFFVHGNGTYLYPYRLDVGVDPRFYHEFVELEGVEEGYFDFHGQKIWAEHDQETNTWLVAVIGEQSHTSLSEMASCLAHGLGVPMSTIKL